MGMTVPSEASLDTLSGLHDAPLTTFFVPTVCFK